MSRILCLAALLFAISAKAQEVKRFYKTLDSLLVVTAEGKCKKEMTEYRDALYNIKLNTLDGAVTQFHAANEGFEKKPGAGCTLLSERIAVIDSFILNRKSNLSSPADSVALLNELAYLRNRTWGYYNVSLKMTEGANASLSIESTLPAIQNRNEYDAATPYELYLFPGTRYDITLKATGYETYQTSLSNIKSDTSITVAMIKSTTDTKPEGPTAPTGPNTNPEQPAKDNINPFALLSILLGAILLSLLIMRLTKRSRSRTATATTIEKEFIPMQSSTNHKAHFVSEIMMTAGPRKKPSEQANADRDLGEDVCGFVMDNDHVLMWILDGASDYFSERNPETGREYFSSRLLAQNMAAKLKQHFEAINASSFAGIVTTIIGEVKNEWMNTIRELPQSEIQALLNNVKDGQFPECAATLLITKLNLSGELQVYRSGDCKLFLYREQHGQLKYIPSTLGAKNTASNDWLFFRLVEKDGTLDIIHNTPLFEVIQETGVQTIIGVSDGIGLETVAGLSRDQPDRNALRTMLTEQVQGTGDDKSLCMIEVVGR